MLEPVEQDLCVDHLLAHQFAISRPHAHAHDPQRVSALAAAHFSVKNFFIGRTDPLAAVELGRCRRATFGAVVPADFYRGIGESRNTGT